MHGDFGRALVPLLAAKQGTTADPHGVKEPFLYQQGEPWMQPVVDFLSWLVRAGLAIPLYGNDGRLNGYSGRYRLTAAGALLLDASDDHPFVPKFVERVVVRCPGLPDEVPVHLTDARACLDHGLGRPAVVLMGLAYEAAENDVVDHLEGQGKLRLKPNARAAEKIARVKDVIPTLLTDLEARGTATAAWDFADRLRERRNHASHANTYPRFDDLSEVHEFMLSAGRNLPGLWSVRV